MNPERPLSNTKYFICKLVLKLSCKLLIGGTFNAAKGVDGCANKKDSFL